MKISWKWLATAALFSSMAYASELKLMTWNVYMLPKPIKFSKQKERTRLITKHLSGLDHDVIVLQEAFTCPFNNRLRRDLAQQWPYQTTLGKSGRWKQIMNSGVTILSKHPFKVLKKDFYQQCTIADCFASKGYLAVELEIDHQPVQLVMTHLQAGKKEKSVRVRQSQLLQIKSGLDSIRKDGVPQLLIGDLNMDALKGSEFSEAMKTLQMTNDPLRGELRSTKSELTSCMGLENSNKQSWIDHIILQNNNSHAMMSDKRVRFIQDTMNGTLCDLSDHRPVEAVISL